MYRNISIVSIYKWRHTYTCSNKLMVYSVGPPLQPERPRQTSNSEYRDVDETTRLIPHSNEEKGINLMSVLMCI